MHPPQRDHPGPFTRLLLLWLAGAALRLTLLAVPSLIPLIHVELGLSETEVGVLSGLPAVLFALAAVPGSLLIARLGARATVIVGLLLCALAGGLRGAATDIALLDVTSVLMALGIAFMQPALPPLVREWMPNRIGLATAVYTNGLVVGEILPVALTIPFVLPWVAMSWRWGLALWSLPVLLITVLFAWLGPDDLDRGPGVTPARWWPDWSNPLVWRLGAMLGAANACYFGTNAFLPDYLHQLGRSDLVSPALSALNIGQLPASFVLLAVAGRLERRVWPYLAGGVTLLMALMGIALSSGAMIIVAAGTIGFAAAGMLVLMLALPPLLSTPGDTHRLTAAMFTVSYSCAMLVSVVSGLAWDLTKVAAVTFAPMGLSAVALIAFAPGVAVKRAVPRMGGNPMD